MSTFDINKIVMESLTEGSSEQHRTTKDMRDLQARQQLDNEGKKLAQAAKSTGNESRPLQGNEIPSAYAARIKNFITDNASKAKEFGKEHGGKAALAGAAIGAGVGAVKLAKKLRERNQR